jgi:hypothetical protein
MIKRAFLPLLLLASSLASAAELTEMEVRWLKAGSAVLAYAGRNSSCRSTSPCNPGASNDVPLALGYDNGRCKLVLSMRGNPNAEDILNNVAEQRPLMIEAMVAHEIGHCWRYVQGEWHVVPSGFEETSSGRAALRDTRREEGYADLVALAWMQQRHPDQYATVAHWMQQVRAPSPASGSHSTLVWLQQAPTGAAFDSQLPLFEQADRLWRQGLLLDR